MTPRESFDRTSLTATGGFLRLEAAADRTRALRASVPDPPRRWEPTLSLEYDGLEADYANVFATIERARVELFEGLAKIAALQGPPS